MEEPTVTIPLEHYNQLRDGASMNKMLFDKIVEYEMKLNDLNGRLMDVEKK